MNLVGLGEKSTSIWTANDPRETAGVLPLSTKPNRDPVGCYSLFYNIKSHRGYFISFPFLSSFLPACLLVNSVKLLAEEGNGWLLERTNDSQIDRICMAYVCFKCRVVTLDRVRSRCAIRATKFAIKQRYMIQRIGEARAKRFRGFVESRCSERTLLPNKRVDYDEDKRSKRDDLYSMKHWPAKVHTRQNCRAEKGRLSFGISLNYERSVVAEPRAWSVYEIVIFRRTAFVARINGNGISVL